MNHHTRTDRVMNTLRRIFRPAKYWREFYSDMDAERYHPEFGSYWQPKEVGGLYLMQAQDVGYKQGYEDGVRKTIQEYMPLYQVVDPRNRPDYEHRVFILHGADTEPSKIRMALDAFGMDGWDVIGMYRQETKDDGFNRIVIGPNPQDVVTVYFRRAKKPQPIQSIRFPTHHYIHNEHTNGCDTCGLGAGAYVHNAEAIKDAQGT